MSKKCLLLKFPDNREVFTNERNYHKLREFSKLFDIKIVNVEADHPTLLKPKEIISTFCDQNNEELSTCSYRIINNNKKLPNTRENILKKVLDIRTYIEDQFLEGNYVRIKELHFKFKEHKIAVSTLYRHISYVKDKLKNDNHNIVKISAGCYQLA